MTLDPKPTPNSDSLEDNFIKSSEMDLTEIEQEIAQLSEFVTSDPALLGGEDVAELLQRLTNAETMAEGMENRIDSVLQNLDSLLDLLDGDGVAGEDKANTFTEKYNQDDVAMNSETQNKM
ncbi:hypothetical protein HYPSUDRAFT_197460 [Hypholoma sublateritium FD-334 SS-4]|uniref:Uncharacterized protein n=1 Tax=Hypholoma sublateritium (strain FD-334 SS-4) TaxID=945553 RepID=A0A0D2LL80_HYPSF|nr:hypothetical protein HYPSUDRAFT_197460 [Hypholoma sublateritium FD-334 SS-4]